MAAPITSLDQLDPNGTYSYADYLTWRLNERVELFRGKIARMSPAPLSEHQKITGRIFSDLERHLRRKTCQVFIAPFDVRLPKKDVSDKAVYTVVQPDISIICDPAKIDRRGCIGAPDTVFEILSQGNLDRDLKQKFSLYEEHGVPEYWIVTPGLQSIAVYELRDDVYQLRAEYDEPGEIPVSSLPGFSLLWEEIFE